VIPDGGPEEAASHLQSCAGKREEQSAQDVVGQKAGEHAELCRHAGIMPGRPACHTDADHSCAGHSADQERFRCDLTPAKQKREDRRFEKCSRIRSWLSKISTLAWFLDFFLAGPSDAPVKPDSPPRSTRLAAQEISRPPSSEPIEDIKRAWHIR
jgi:hypothetical protein